jgi:hypothetical protein
VSDAPEAKSGDVNKRVLAFGDFRGRDTPGHNYQDHSNRSRRRSRDAVLAQDCGFSRGGRPKVLQSPLFVWVE